MSILLKGILTNLNEKELDDFIFYLQNFKLKRYDTIPKGALPRPRDHEIVTKMIETYLVNGALEVTEHILKQMKRKDLVQKLKPKIKTGGGDGEGETVSNDEPGTSTGGKSVSKKPPVKKTPKIGGDGEGETVSNDEPGTSTGRKSVSKKPPVKKTPKIPDDRGLEAVSNGKPETSTRRTAVPKQPPVGENLAFEGSISNVSRLQQGGKGKYFTAKIRTATGCLLVLILDLDQHQRFRRAEKRKSRAKLTGVSKEPLGIDNKKPGLKFTRKSILSFTRKKAIKLEAE